MVRLFRDPPMAREKSSGDAHHHSSLLSLKHEQSLPFFESYQFVAWDQIDYGPWRNGQNVWVCKSTGRRKKNRPIGDHGCADGGDTDAAGPPVLVATHQRQRRPELFLRACIACANSDGGDGDRRILVRYPAGSTYRVRRDLLVPILDVDTCACTTVSSSIDNNTAIFNSDDDNRNHLQNNNKNLIVVYAETNEYRRACVTHTGPNEHFLEIGCAQGVTCHRVHLTGDRNTTPTTAKTSNRQHAQRRRTVVGLDKSESAIATARQRYPECHFLTADILEEWNDPGDDAVNRLSPPAVVALDVNGNREREAVLQCLEAVLARWRPRLVLVKSRALYHCVVAVRHENS